MDRRLIMSTFLKIHDRKQDLDLQTNISSIKTYKSQDEQIKDKTSYLVVYTLNHNIIIEEEFSNQAEQQQRIDQLNTIFSN